MTQQTIWIELQGKRRRVDLSQGAPTLVDGVAYDVDWAETEPGVFSLLWTDVEGRTRSFRCVTGEGALEIDGEPVEYALYDPRSLRSFGPAAGGASGPRALKAPMPGRIVRLLVQAGEQVEAGKGCLVMEAMKMQNELKAPRAGIIKKVNAVEGETVAAGAVLLVIE
jgi:biotin carboxyl carrier protein